jgi:hypothetical protein
MEVTRDVILDLLPLYLANEASPATRRLVDDFLRADPALAEVVSVEHASLRGAHSTVATPPDLELRMLSRTRFLLRSQRWLFGLSWFFTAIALSIRVRVVDGGVRQIGLALADSPVALVTAALSATASWIAYVTLRRRTRAAGVS